MSPVTTQPMPDVRVESSGPIPAQSAEYARAKVAAAIGRYAPSPVLHARVRLALAADHAVAFPATAQASLDVNGRFVRAHAAAQTPRAAADLLHDRLRAQLTRLSGAQRARRS